MRNTLGLDDDLEGVELVQNLEAAFGVKFSSRETEACGTVADIFALLTARFSAKGVRNQGCASAMAFYRLKRAFKDAGTSLTLAPTSRLDEISSLPPKVLFRKVRAHSGLRLPNIQSGRLGSAGFCVILLGAAAVLGQAVLHSRLVLFPVAVAAIGGILMRMDRGAFPDACQTLGDLARKVAGLNLGGWSHWERGSGGAG